MCSATDYADYADHADEQRERGWDSRLHALVRICAMEPLNKCHFERSEKSMLLIA